MSDMNISYFQKAGIKQKDEDRIFVSSDKPIFAVLDGHKDEYAAEETLNFLQTSSMNIVNSFSLHQRAFSSTLNFPVFQKQENVDMALNSVFSEANQTLKEKKIVSGTTLTLILFFFLGTSDEVFFKCANVGDSMCYVIKNGSLKNLSEMHRAENPLERERIINDDPTALVFTNELYAKLSTSRALGDFEYEPGISHTPYICPEQIFKSDEIILLATDGLWDHISQQEVLNEVSRNSLSDLPESLCMVARDNGSQDDLSILVLQIS
eukprot:augustus_masked-scaffold_5-processed-gene-11.41-mRNA-1 protein AED:1.00 eAED:1.00 QI:0/-1/0/0/-1/1/1/0/265